MRPRELLAPALLAAHHVFGATPKAGSFRILLLHDVPRARYDSLARLLDWFPHDAFIAPDEALARREGPPRLVLNFDDGFKGNRDVAERLLAPRGIKAIFFVNPGRIEADRDRTYMDWDDLAALVAAGHVIGSHGWSHRRLVGLKGGDLEEQIVRPQEAIGARLGVRSAWFAYPFGDIDSIDLEALAQVGRHYRVCRSGVRGVNAPGAHRLALLSDHLDLDANFAWQRLTAAGGLDGRYARARERLLDMARSAESS
jgi:peptidoglycan/xylan/chitin deacetylase (PgdA/CDA1 family)